MTSLNQKTVQRLFMAATITLSLSSCLGPRMVNKWVAHHYQENPSEAPKKKNDQITIIPKLPGTDDKPSMTEKNVSHLLADVNVQMSLRMWQSLKKLTWHYLQDYDANITAMSKKCMDKVSAEL